MSNVRKINYHNISLFEDNSNTTTANCLKDFLYYLKFKGNRGVIDFAYSCETDSLHPSLTIQDNFILDAVPTSLIKDGKNNLNEFLSTLKNPYLAELIEVIGPLDQKVSSLDQKTIYLTSIIKSLLSTSEYIFLVQPEKQQSFETIHLIKKCIEFEVENNFKKFFIKPCNKESWLDISTHIITKCNETHHYQESTNPLYQAKAPKNFKATYNFSLLKKTG